MFISIGLAAAKAAHKLVRGPGSEVAAFDDARQVFRQVFRPAQQQIRAEQAQQAGQQAGAAETSTQSGDGTTGSGDGGGLLDTVLDWIGEL